jgi:uncharacterized protein (TIGR02001 family)
LSAISARRGFGLGQRRLAPGMAMFMAVLMAGPARAQLSLAVSLDTDYRLRGYSLTEGRPALSASLGYDATSGLYLGASGVAADPPGPGVRSLGYIAYAGYARRFAGGRSLDVGLSRTRLKTFEQPRWSALRYTEAYLGASSEHLSFRALYSPHYIRDGAKALYLDLGASAQPAERWRATAHAGLLRYLDRPPSWSGRTSQYDLRGVLAREFDHGDLHLTWTLRGPDARRAAARSEGRSSLDAGVTYVF